MMHGQQNVESKPVCPSGKANVYMKISMELQWNYADSRKPWYWEKNLSQRYFVHHKCRIE